MSVPLWIEVILKRPALWKSFEEDIGMRRDNASKEAISYLNEGEMHKAQSSGCLSEAYSGLLNIVSRYQKEEQLNVSIQEKREGANNGR